jgi:hypothetical protein
VLAVTIYPSSIANLQLQLQPVPDACMLCYRVKTSCSERVAETDSAPVSVCTLVNLILSSFTLGGCLEVRIVDRGRGV